MDALALSYVARPALHEPAPGEMRVASDFGDAPTLLAYFSVNDEASGIMLRDMSWLTERFGRRGLRVIAISVDGETSAAAVSKEAEWRDYPYEWVVDSPEHARRISTGRDMPMGFLVRNGRVVRHSFGIVQDQGRTIWGGARIQMELDDSLPKAP